MMNGFNLPSLKVGDKEQLSYLKNGTFKIFDISYLSLRLEACYNGVHFALKSAFGKCSSTVSRKYRGSLGARRPFVRPVKRTIGKTIGIGNECQDPFTQVSDRRPTSAS